MNNSILVTVAAPAGTDPYRIDAAALTAELATAGFIQAVNCENRHDAVTAIVVCDAADEAAVRAVIAAHIVNTEKREANKAVLKQITALEATVTQRMLRERGPQLVTIDAQIAALRGTLRK